MEIKTIRYKNGIYVGEVLDGKRHGHGTYTWDNGTVYEGAYNLKAYYDHLVLAGEAQAASLIEALWKYSLSAKAYRDEAVKNSV